MVCPYDNDNVLVSCVGLDGAQEVCTGNLTFAGRIYFSCWVYIYGNSPIDVRNVGDVFSEQVVLR